MNAQPKKLNISDHTKNEMVKFFLRTSVPRILEKERKAKQNNRDKNSYIET